MSAPGADERARPGCGSDRCANQGCVASVDCLSRWLPFGFADAPSEARPWIQRAFMAGVRQGSDFAVRQVEIDPGTRDTLEGRRDPDYRPCAVKCQRCSRCAASLAYWSRGGRPFEGVEQERQRALVKRGAA